jgi:hypothetical protein
MNVHVEGRSQGAALASMTPEEIKPLVLLARKAFDYLCAMGQLGDAAEFDAWRHAQCLITVERSGFRECRHEDFLPLKAHFLRLLGREAEADNALLRQETQPRRHAMHSLDLACEEAEAAATDAGLQFDGKAYAGGFLRNKRHVSIEDADEKAIWHAVYVLRRKAASMRKKDCRTLRRCSGQAIGL